MLQRAPRTRQHSSATTDLPFRGRGAGMLTGAAARQGLAADRRPEVRNSAVRTLFAVVVGQGARLGPAAWDECLWHMLFPLLRAVHHMAATSSREEARARPTSAAESVSSWSCVFVYLHLLMCTW